MNKTTHTPLPTGILEDITERFRFDKEVRYDVDYFGLNTDDENSPDYGMSHEYHVLTCQERSQVNEILVFVDATPFDQDGRAELPDIIVTAVNSHDRLVEALRQVVGEYHLLRETGDLRDSLKNGTDVLENARALLAELEAE